MHVKDGNVVHVDFNMIFNRGEDLPVKEVGCKSTMWGYLETTTITIHS